MDFIRKNVKLAIGVNGSVNDVICLSVCVLCDRQPVQGVPATCPMTASIGSGPPPLQPWTG